MQPTIRHLAAAFPYQKLKALGYEDPEIPTLEGLVSGDQSEADVQALYAEARIIVYPSQYEGFGLPIVRGLSFGKDVIARKSELVRELANHYGGPGRLIEFDTTEGLVEAVVRALHGLPSDCVALGSNLAPEQQPRSWKDVGADIVEFIENRTRKPDSSNWERRQAIVSQIEAYGAVQREWDEQ